MDESVDSIHLECLKIEFGYDGQQYSKRGCRKCGCPCWQITLPLLVPTHDQTHLALHEPSMLVSLVFEDPLTAKGLVSFGFGFIDNHPGFEHVDVLIYVLFHLVPELPLEVVAL